MEDELGKKSRVLGQHGVNQKITIGAVRSQLGKQA